MTPLYFAVLALVFLWSLVAYALHQAPAGDVRHALQVGGRAVVALALGSLGMLLAHPADGPGILRAVMARY
ncbi:hypothetical protein ACH4YN_39520 [Streptomyces griseofuscus]|uniref:hypothetical protein n=1 Tax=Streptomyces griseofuscus TaxID=146922 RepID=UPI0037968F04